MWFGIYTVIMIEVSQITPPVGFNLFVVQGITGDGTHTGHVGGYQDVYVKTAQGWRFKKRIHVFPPAIPGSYVFPPDEPAPATK